MTSDDEFVQVELGPDWLLVNPEEPADNAAVHREDLNVDGDGNEDQNNQKTQNDRETVKEKIIDEWAYVFSARDESSLEFEGGICKIDVHNAPYEDDDKIAHVFSYEWVIFEGSCENNDADEDTCGRFHVESPQNCSADARKEEEEDDGGGDEDDDDDDDYEYNDALHEDAIQDEVNNSLVDAMERYLTNPVKECCQEYICSVQTEIRRELHEAKVANFHGYGPEPRPFINGSACFNPLFEEMWLPWATKAEYCHDEDMGLLVWDGVTGSTQCTLAAKRYMSSAVPTLPVLEYMVHLAPRKKIAHIGSCVSLYWAALLHQLGAANVIVTEGTYPVTCIPEGVPHIEQIEEEMFFMLNMAVEHALFFLRPAKRSRDAEPCMAERCLFIFPGDTIFFVGECGQHASNFDMAQWVEEHALEGWHVEKEVEIPCWPGSHDEFLCITKSKHAYHNIR